MPSPSSIDSLLKNPRYNEKLAILNYAKKLASQYNGYVPGGKGSNYLSKILSQTLGANPLFEASPFSKNNKPPLDINIELSNNVFEAIYNRNLAPKLQLQVLTKQREELQQKEENDRLERARLSQAFRGVSTTIKDVKAETDKFIANLFPDKSTVLKNSQYLTDIPSYINISPKEEIIFDKNNDKAFDFKDLTNETAINAEAPDHLSLSADAPRNLAQISSLTLSSSTTHVAVRLTGKAYLDFNPSYPNLTPYIPKVEDPQGSLSSSGVKHNPTEYKILTVAKWQQVEFQFSTTATEKTTIPDFLSVIPLQDVNGDGQFTNLDKRGESVVVPILPADEVIQPLVTQADSQYSYTSKIPFGLNANTADVAFETPVPDLLARIASQEVEVIVSELGRDVLDVDYPVATLDLANSTNDSLRFTFDRSITDGFNIDIFQHNFNLALKSLSIATKYI